MARSDKRIDKAVLVREVMSPGREQTGIAVILVAASALAFALAGSAFALWARSASQCEHLHTAPVITVDADDSASAVEPPCVTTVQTDRNGEAEFRACPDAATTIQPAHEVIIEETEGMVVYRIIK